MGPFARGCAAMQHKATGAALHLEAVGGQHFDTGVNCEWFQGLHGPHIHQLRAESAVRVVVSQSSLVVAAQFTQTSQVVMRVGVVWF